MGSYLMSFSFFTTRHVGRCFLMGYGYAAFNDFTQGKSVKDLMIDPGGCLVMPQ